MQFLQPCQRKFPVAFPAAPLHRRPRHFAAIAAAIVFRASQPGKRVFGSSRLPDVKPPCSTMAGNCGFPPFLFPASDLGSQLGAQKPNPTRQLETRR